MDAGIWLPAGSQSASVKTTIGRPSAAPAEAISKSSVSLISPVGRNTSASKRLAIGRTTSASEVFSPKTTRWDDRRPSKSVIRRRRQAGGGRDVDIDTDRHPSLGLDRLLDVDDRRAVARVDDARERDIAEKPRRLRGSGEPFPGGVVIDVRRAIGLALAEQRIVQSAQMDAPRAADGAVERFGEPAPSRWPARRVDTIRVIARPSTVASAND